MGEMETEEKEEKRREKEGKKGDKEEKKREKKEKKGNKISYRFKLLFTCFRTLLEVSCNKSLIDIWYY